MMEAIAIEVLGAGGKAQILTTTDGERQYRAQRLPIEYLGPPPSSILRFGGTNAQPRWIVPLTRATVFVDGVAIVSDGRLTVGSNP